MTAFRRALLAAFVAFAALSSVVADVARAQEAPARREPYIGYVFPAGGRRGTNFQITAGGQNLATVADVLVSGDGVHAAIIRYEGQFRFLDGDQRKELRRRLEELRAKLKATAAGKPTPPAATPPATKPVDGKPPERAALPDIPMLRDLDKMSLKELDRVELRFLVNPDQRKQPNAQIAETVLIDVEIDAGAAPGPREMRLVARAGITNSLRFEVGVLPEFVEEEARPGQTVGVPVLDAPVLVNGQIMPGDVDRFRIHGRRGQRLVVETHARSLMPYLADAVPGWFQAAVQLADLKGVEIGFADHWRHDPDPVMLCEIPREGDYVLTVNDALYRGREDFVYRISVGETPFVTSMFPLGAHVGVDATALIGGWNLPTDALKLDTRAGAADVRFVTLVGDFSPIRLPYIVDTLPERRASEDPEGPGEAQRITLPQIIDGRIALPGEAAAFQFDGYAGMEVVAEVYARRLGSPLDSILRLTDPTGKVVAWNDDHEDRESGLLTHQADSYLRAKLTTVGPHRLTLADAQRHGGEEYAYRLRIERPHHDFSLIATPSSLNVPSGRVAPITVYAVRKDGFDGDIDLALKDAPDGFALGGGRIPSGRDSVRVTLAAPAVPPLGPVTLRIEGRARIGGKDVVREIVPAQDMMQAFAYRHLVPSQEFVVAVLGGGGPTASLDLPDAGRVRIPAGGSAHVRIVLPRKAWRTDLMLELSDAPQGVTIGEATQTPTGFDVVLKCDAKAPAVGYADNLIVEAVADVIDARPAVANSVKPRRVGLGYLPAIPIEIVRP